MSESTTHAICDGDIAIGDTLVALLIRDSITNRNSSCTVTLLTPQIVIGAAHCLDTRATHFGLPYDTSSFISYADIWVARPGVDVLKDDTSTRVKIVKDYIIKGWSSTVPCTVIGMYSS